MKKIKRSIGLFLLLTMFIAMNCLVALAADDSNYEGGATYNSAQELRAAQIKELEAEGVQVIGGKAFEATIVDAKAKGPSIVNVSLSIGYVDDPKIGLNAYLVASSKDLNCQIKRMTALIAWEDLDSAAKGMGDMSVSQIVPTYRIESAYESGAILKSGHRIYCNAYGDVDAINEISGGEFDLETTVTIP